MEPEPPVWPPSRPQPVIHTLRESDGHRPAPIIVEVDVHKDDDHNWCWCGATCVRHCGAADGEVVDVACVYTGPSSRSGGGEHHHP